MTNKKELDMKMETCWRGGALAHLPLRRARGPRLRRDGLGAPRLAAGAGGHRGCGPHARAVPSNDS